MLYRSEAKGVSTGHFKLKENGKRKKKEEGVGTKIIIIINHVKQFLQRYFV